MTDRKNYIQSPSFKLSSDTWLAIEKSHRRVATEFRLNFSSQIIQAIIFFYLSHPKSFTPKFGIFSQGRLVLKEMSMSFDRRIKLQMR